LLDGVKPAFAAPESKKLTMSMLAILIAFLLAANAITDG
jgi:hypothetical protein